MKEYMERLRALNEDCDYRRTEMLVEALKSLLDEDGISQKVRGYVTYGLRKRNIPRRVMTFTSFMIEYSSGGHALMYSADMPLVVKFAPYSIKDISIINGNISFSMNGVYISDNGLDIIIDFDEEDDK